MKTVRAFQFALLLAPLAVLAAADSKPSIVLILADDLGYGSLGCFGNTEVRTPNLDRLAATGVRLTDFHSNGPMCSPTRASLMTGRYQQRCARVADAELSPVFRAQRQENLKQRWAWGIATNEVTLPALLREAGYRTALIGKWHLGYDFKFHPLNYGFDEFRGFVGGNVDYHTHIAGYGTKELDWWRDQKIENEPGYTTDLLTQYATNFIARNQGRPFFLYIAHAAPHEPWQGRDPKSKKSPAETYKEMIAVLDESVGAVIAALRRHQLETNTRVVFCSDNGPAAPLGFAANGPLQGKKGTLFEGGHRVPFIAAWPGVIPGGGSNSEVALTMDLLPTLAKLVGATIPAGHLIDGVDLLPVLKGEGKLSERVLHWQHAGAWAVRRGEWKLAGRGDKATTLVNLEADLGENQNRLKEKPELADALMKLRRQWLAEVGDN
jgi:arylsulfatase A-like enzyme